MSTPNTLLVSASLPPTLLGSTSIVTGLAREFSREEMTLVGQLAPGPPENDWPDDPSLPVVAYVHRQWPFKFKRTFRLFCIPVIFLRMLKVIRKTQCDQILAVYPDELFLFLSWLLAQVTGKRLFSYFHNTYLENKTGIKRLFARWLQPCIFRNSEVVFVMSDGMKRRWDALYPDTEFRTLVHTSADLPVPKTFEQPISNSFRIGFMGNINDSNRDALSRLQGVLEAFPQSSATTFSGASITTLRSVGLDLPNVTHTRVAQDQVVNALSKFDLLFLPHGFQGGLSPIEYETIFPTRTVPYLLSGVPIIAHTPENAFLTHWLSDHDCAEVVSEPSVEAICEAVKRLQQDRKRCQLLVANAQSAAKQFDAASVSSSLRNVLSGNR